jgi:hypothetical protein
MDETLTHHILRETLVQVQRDEAAAIEALCALLERIEKSSKVECLPAVREVMKEWQNLPPRVIFASLMKIEKQFEQQCPARAKK